MEFTLKEAFAYYQSSKLEDWIQKFLREEDGIMPNPNLALADGLLLEDRQYFYPVCIPLEYLKTIRTEKDILDENELKHFTYKVDEIIKKMSDWDMPPLIAQYNGCDFVLTDGNHRYSALKKISKSNYYTIVWCNKDIANMTWDIMKHRGWVIS